MKVHSITALSRFSRLAISVGLVLLVIAAAAALALPGRPAEARSHAPHAAPEAAQQTTQTPELTIAAASATVTEGGWAQFTVSASPAPGGSLTVKYTVSQSGEFTHQYKQIWIDQNLGSKTLELSEATGTIIVPTVDDNVLNHDGSVTVTLTAGGGYTLGSSSSATVTRVENEAVPYLTISANAGSVNEGSPASFTLSLQPNVGLEMTANYRVMQNGDYVAAGDLGDQSVTFSGSGKTISVPTVDDAAVEPDGSALVVLLPGTGYRLGTSNIAATTVKSDDVPAAPPMLSVSADAAWYVEGDTVEFTVSASPPVSGSVTVRYRLMQNGDYIASGDVGSKTLTLAGSSAAVTVSTVDDGDYEPGGEGSALLLLLPGDGYLLGTPNAAQTTVRNNDETPAVTVSGGPEVAEGQDASYVFSVSPAPSSPLTVRYTVSQNGDVVDAQSVGSRQVTLTGSRTVVTVSTDDDDVGEPDDSVTVTVNDGAGYRAGSPASASVTVRDDEGYPAITVTGAPQSVLEGGSFDLTFHASELRISSLTPGMDVSFRVERAGETSYLSSVFFWRTATSMTATIDTYKDGKVGPDETVTVTILPGANYQVGAPSSVSVTVKNTDVTVPTLKVSGKDATEGSPLTFTVSADAAPTAPVTVYYTVERRYDPGNVVASSELGDKSLSLTGTKATISIPTTDNDYNDGEASYEVKLHVNRPGYRVGGTGWFADANVIDDEAEVKITAEVNVTRVTEGAPAVFTLKASPAPAGSLTVNYEVTQDGDVVAASELGQKTLTLTGSSAAITIPTIDDANEEQSGAVRVEVLSGRGYVFDYGSTSSAVQYVNDNDKRGKPTISVTGPSEVTEGSAINYTITSNPAPSGDLTVVYWVGSDESGDGRYIDADELGVQTVTVTGASTTVSIPTAGDEVDEADAAVYFAIQSDNAYTVHGTANLVITTVKDDDVTMPELFVRGSGSVAEGGDVEFTIRANPVPTGSLTVKYRVSQSGDFVADDDLGEKTLTLSGRIATVTVPTVDDDADENDGSVTVTILDGAGYVVSANEPSKTRSVEDDDE